MIIFEILNLESIVLINNCTIIHRINGLEKKTNCLNYFIKIDPV